jgi:hypothetical protein
MKDPRQARVSRMDLSLLASFAHKQQVQIFSILAGAVSLFDVSRYSCGTECQQTPPSGRSLKGGGSLPPPS